MEGIETPSLPSRSSLSSQGVSRCPDMEGIETVTGPKTSDLVPCVSRCPDMEGIETSRYLAIFSNVTFCVSRCPDMEGIETARQSMSIALARTCQ